MRLDGLLPSNSGILGQTTCLLLPPNPESEEKRSKSELTEMMFEEEWLE
jgi:hypothetical protein